MGHTPHPHGPPPTGHRLPEPDSVQHQVERLLADRQGPEARALFVHLAGVVDRRLSRRHRDRYGDLLTEAQREELVGDVLFELMNGALATFRGDTTGELVSFVNCIADRKLWRAAQRRIRERDFLDDETHGAAVVREWSGTLPGPSKHVRFEPACPLPDADRDYLCQLLAAGSRADLARATGVSRAAVTQRVQRIKRRISQMSAREQAAAEAWMRREAERVEASRERLA